MKTRVFLSALFLLISIYGNEADKNTQPFPFECPKGCKTSGYEPICSRGKSYHNLCTIKQLICGGDIDLEIYNDIEACPVYDKEAEANGASVEAIDKNGVLLRRLFDFTEKNTYPSRTRRSVDPSEEFRPNRDSTRVKKNYDKIIRHEMRHISKMYRSMCRDGSMTSYCSIQEMLARPVCVFDREFSNFCALKLRVCRAQLPIVAIFLALPCEDSWAAQ